LCYSLNDFLRYRLKVTARGKIAAGVFFDSSAKLLIFLNMVVLAITVTIQLTRHSNGQITVGFCSFLAILANYHLPLNVALVAATCPVEFICRQWRFA